MTVIRTQGILNLIEALTDSHRLIAAQEDHIADLQGDGTVKTTELFWNCECKTNYIHPRTKYHCLRCYTRQEDQPDSRVDEVARYGLIVGTPMGKNAPTGRAVYFLSELVKDRNGNYIPCIAVEGQLGYYVTSWEWGSDRKHAEQIAEEMNAGLGISPEQAIVIQLSTMRF